MNVEWLCILFRFPFLHDRLRASYAIGAIPGVARRMEVALPVPFRVRLRTVVVSVVPAKLPHLVRAARYPAPVRSIRAISGPVFRNHPAVSAEGLEYGASYVTRGQLAG